MEANALPRDAVFHQRHNVGECLRNAFFNNIQELTTIYFILA